MKTLRSILIVPLLLLPCLPAAARNTWYVDLEGTPPGTGTQVDPYTEIQYAIDQLTTLDGDTILVAPGTYQEFVNVDKAVFLRSIEGPLVTKILSPAPNGIALFLGGAAQREVEGFTIKGPANRLIYQDAGRVIDCIVDGRDQTWTGFDMFGGTMEGCTVTGCSVGVRGDMLFDSALHMYGCVVWGNTQDVDDSTLVLAKVVEYSAGLDGDPKWLAQGPGNVIGDPGLWAVEFHDLWPAPGSPCIDAGDPSWPLEADGSRADIGALTYDPTHVYGPLVYCTAKTASGGCVPAISASGTSSATAPVPFTVAASSIVEDVLGILIHGPSVAELPFNGAFLCIGGSITRTAPQFSGSTGAPCSGSYAFDFNAYVQGGGAPPFVPGDLVFAQYWFRDPNDPAGFSSGLSDAVRFGIGL